MSLCEMCKSSSNGNNLISVYSVSLDYTLKYMVINIESSEIVKKIDIYSHRGGIQDMLKVNNMVFTIGRDLYLKYACLNENDDEGLNISNQSMYKLSSTPI